MNNQSAAHRGSRLHDVRYLVLGFVLGCAAVVACVFPISSQAMPDEVSSDVRPDSCVYDYNQGVRVIFTNASYEWFFYSSDSDTYRVFRDIQLGNVKTFFSDMRRAGLIIDPEFTFENCTTLNKPAPVESGEPAGDGVASPDIVGEEAVPQVTGAALDQPAPQAPAKVSKKVATVKKASQAKRKKTKRPVSR